MLSDSRKTDPKNSTKAIEQVTSRSFLAKVRNYIRLVLINFLFFLFIIVSIPLTLYFTYLTPSQKQEIRNLVADYKSLDQTKLELIEAKRQISNLEKELDAAKLVSNLSPPKLSAPPPSDGFVSKTPLVEKLTRMKENEKVSTLKNGISVRSFLDIGEGEIASKVRGKVEAYEIETRLKIDRPVAIKSLGELSALNPQLPKILPGLNDLLEDGKVSPLFEKIYKMKFERIIKSFNSPGEMETRHNFFDCETILDLTDPKTKQRVVLIQGEMDVVADGTDGDRWPDTNQTISRSSTFQYSTSYRWDKMTNFPNPLLSGAEAELKKVLARYSIKGLSESENVRLQNRRDELARNIGEMKSKSFLIGEVDPFIVLPLSFLDQSTMPHAPAIGDFAVVIYENKLYPAICGDAGPPWKIGEGSLFLAQALNPKSSPSFRPVSDLKVTYLVFPGTRPTEKGPPDLITWRNRCQELIERFGGLGEEYALHNWRDLPSERLAAKELEQLAKEFAPSIVKFNKAVVEAKKALDTAEGKAGQLKKEFEKLEAEAKPTTKQESGVTATNELSKAEKKNEKVEAKTSEIVVETTKTPEPTKESPMVVATNEPSEGEKKGEKEEVKASEESNIGKTGNTAQGNPDQEKISEEKLKKEMQARVEKAEKARLEWLAAVEQKSVKENELKKAELDSKAAQDLGNRFKTAIEEAQAIALLPVSTHRELSTDIVLTTLEQNKAALAKLKEGAID